nr:hypothetical protein CFP56_62772 [Quercus suber]
MEILSMYDRIVRTQAVEMAVVLMTCRISDAMNRSREESKLKEKLCLEHIPSMCARSPDRDNDIVRVLRDNPVFMRIRLRVHRPYRRARRSSTMTVADETQPAPSRRSGSLRSAVPALVMILI